MEWRLNFERSSVIKLSGKTLIFRHGINGVKTVKHTPELTARLHHLQGAN